jgi:hypothetical protein
LQWPLLRRCRCPKCSDATAFISVWLPPPPISAMMPSRSVRGCPRIIPNFFQPYCEMRSYLLRGCPGPHSDIFLSSAVIFYLSLCCDITVALPLGCPHHFRKDVFAPYCHPILPINETLRHPFREDAPAFNVGMPSSFYRGCLRLYHEFFAAPYCGFAPLSTAKMPLQFNAGMPSPL